jgi:hypothetical protein
MIEFHILTAIASTFGIWTKTKGIFTSVGMQCQEGLDFALLLLLGESLVKILLYSPILFNFTMISSRSSPVTYVASFITGRS